MPNLSRQFILFRAQRTCAVAGTIAGGWSWDRLTVAQLNGARVNGEQLLDDIATAEAATGLARGQLDGLLDPLYSTAVQGLGLARRHFATVAGKERIFDGITAEGQSRDAKRRTIRRFLKAWAQADTAWQLNLLAGNVSFTAFLNQRRTIEGDDNVNPPVAGLVDSLAMAEQAERLAAEALNRALLALETTMEAWYADATTACPAGTAEGDQIRGQIPTTYDPNQEPLPIPPTPAGLAAQAGLSGGGADAVCLPASFAAEYVWTATLVSDPAQVSQVTSTEPMVSFAGLPVASIVAITVAAQNATGISAPSAAVNTETGA